MSNKFSDVRDGWFRFEDPKRNHVHYQRDDNFPLYVLVQDGKFFIQSVNNHADEKPLVGPFETLLDAQVAVETLDFIQEDPVMGHHYIL